MSRWGVAETDDDEETPVKPPRGRRHLFTYAGERVPPIHKPFKRGGCQWVDGVGWVWNPTGRRIA